MPTEDPPAPRSVLLARGPRGPVLGAGALLVLGVPFAIGALASHQPSAPEATLQSSDDPLALTGGTVIPATGEGPLPETNVLVEYGRITCVGTPDRCAPDDEHRIVDVAGKWVVPGLVDGHVHFSQTGWVDGRPDALDLRGTHPYEETVSELRNRPDRFFRAYLCSGVTSVFDVGGYPWSWDLRHAPGPRPRVAAAGPLLSTRDHWLNMPAERQFLHLQDEDAVTEGVAYLAAHGTDAVKVWYLPIPGSEEEARYRPRLMEAGREADRAGLPLIVHATYLEGAKDAIRAGARLLVHSVSDQEVDDEFLDLAREAGTFYNPTLIVSEGYHEVRAGIFREDRYPLDCVDGATLEKARRTPEVQSSVDPEEVALSARNLEVQAELMARNLRRVHGSGIPVVMGTDAGNPHTLHGPSVHLELEAMQEAGLSPHQVLVAATLHGARAMGLGEEVGSLEAGKSADLLVLQEDPLEDVRAFRTLTKLVVGGELHPRDTFLPREGGR